MDRASTTEQVHIVETTLRDGGYEFDHQVTADDTAFLTSALDRAGFTYIEIGHGNGVGSENWESSKKMPLQAAATDAQHFDAVRGMAPRAQVGVIIVVGLTPVDMIDRVAAAGLKFLRLGLPPELFTNHATWLPYVERAKAAGLIVSMNLMQTSVIPVAQVAEGAIVAARHGADWFYIVDSFGGMTPNVVREYVHALRDSTSLVVGLHAHNNSGLAVANSLAAVEAGARLVDSTLQGIGRTTGNPATELMVLALRGLGHELGIDMEATMQLGELARQLVAEKGNDPLHFVSGAANVHSRVLNEMRRVAESARKPLRPFLLQLGAEAKRRALSARDSFPDDVVRSALDATPATSARTAAPALVQRLAATCERESDGDLVVQAEAVTVAAIRARKTGVLHLVDAAQFPFDGPLPWTTGELVGISVPVGAAALPSLSTRVPQVVVIDAALAATGRSDLPAGRTHTLRAAFAPLFADAAAGLAAALGLPVWLADDGLELVGAALRARGIAVSDAPPPQGARVAITRGGEQLLAQLRAGDRVITLDVEPRRAAFVDRARRAEATVLLPPIGARIAAYVVGELGALQAATSAVEPQAVGNNRIVEPTIAPGTGELVVDSRDAPRRVVDQRDTSPSYEELAQRRAEALLNGRAGL